MKNFRSKFLVKIVASLCIVISLLWFLPNNRVFADPSEDEVYGSVLITPITQLLTGIGDGAMDLIHKTVLEQDETIIRLDSNADSWWNQHGASVLGWVLGIGVIVAMIALTATGGAGLAAAGALAGKAAGVAFTIKSVITSIGYGIAVGTSVFAVATIVDATMLGDDLYLPVFNLTPEEIFSNQIWIFDVNFFEPDDEKQYFLQKDAEVINVHGSYEKATTYYEELYEQANKIKENDSDGVITIEEAKNIAIFSKIIDDVNTELQKKSDMKLIQDSIHKFKVNTANYKKNADFIDTLSGISWIGATKINVEIFITYKSDDTNTSEYVSIKYNLDKEMCTTDNVHNQMCKESLTVQQTEKISTKKTSIATELKGVISQWYYTLRNLAVIILLLLLVYSGIRIVTGSTAGEKAKYKERTIDWLVSICLIFMMHYIMVFAVELNDKFVEIVNSYNGIKGVDKFIELNTNNHLNLATKDARLNDFIRDGEELGATPGTKYLEWPTDIMGGFRIEQQKVNEGTANWIGYSICYLVLVVYTVIFTWTYLRRVLYMAFLTLISPLVAMTYSLDKITDGEAQAFNSWIREYIFNLLIQPFHLILYTVLITSAYELAGDNALYAAVAIGFMTPAEKLLRKFFGFEKAQTPGALGGAAGAALAMGGLQQLISWGNKESNATQEHEENKEIKYSRGDGVSAGETVANDQISDLNGGDSNTSSGSDTTIRIPNGAGRTVTEGSKINIEEENSDPPIKDGENGTTITVPSTRMDERTIIQKPPTEVVTTQTGNRSGTENVTENGSGVTTTGGTTTGVTTTGETSTSSGNNKHIVLNGTSDSKKKNPRRFRRIKAVGTGIASYSRALGRKNYKRINKSRPIRSLARGIAGLYGGAAMGLAGLVLGIASGDPNKAFQYTTTAAIGGWGVGKGLAGRTVDTFTVDTDRIKQEMSLSYQGEDYKNHQLEKQKKELARDEESIMYLRKTLGVSRADAIKILKTTGADCLDNGIEDIEDIATQHQYKMNNVQSTLEDMANQEVDAEVMRRIGGLTEEELQQAKQDADKKFESEEKAIEEEEKKLNIDLEQKADKVATAEFNALIAGEDAKSEEAKKAKAELDRIDKEKGERIKQIDKDYETRLQSAKDQAEKEDLEKAKEQAKKDADADADKQMEIAKQDLKKDIQKRIESDTQAKLGKRKEKLEQKKKELEQKKKELEQKNKQILLEKKKNEERQKDWYKELVDKKKREAEEALRERNELYEKALKRTFEQGVAFKKFSNRTPDFNKLGEDKIDSYRRLFKKEMHDQIVDQLVDRGYSRADAIKFAEERSEQAANAIINGVKKIDKVQSGLTEVSDE